MRVPAQAVLAFTVQDNGLFWVDPSAPADGPQQFVMMPDARGYSLQPLPRDQWVSHPSVLQVDSMYGRSKVAP